ncbi:tetratricopeptide repeat protein 21A isoform X4, partial [Silurus meridionalis]
LIYLLRERLYRQVINTALNYLKLYPNDPVLLFFKAFAALNEGRFQEAVRELNILRDKPQVSLCSVMALLWAHRQRETTDEEAVSELESCLKRAKRTAGDKALYYVALLYWILGRNQKAKENIDKMLKLSSGSSEGHILKCWIVLTSESDVERSHATRYFDSGIFDIKNVFGLMGKIEFFMARQKESYALNIVNQIIASYPDFIPALVLKMNIFMALHNWEHTTEVAERILEIDAHNLKALQMLSIISAAKDGDVEKLRQKPQYNLIKARALKRAGQLSEAIQCLHMVISMPGVKRIVKTQENLISRSERVSFFLELADALRLNGEQHEATKVIQDAMWQFKDTPEEVRVMIANVDLALAKDNIDAALNALGNIIPGEPIYIHAKEKMACIYLERLRNKRLYIACYREISKHLPGLYSTVLLGDAFMKIQEPDKAIKVYQEAVKMAPNDATLAKKIGQALVRTHQYDKAS